MHFGAEEMIEPRFADVAFLCQLGDREVFAAMSLDIRQRLDDAGTAIRRFGFFQAREQCAEQTVESFERKQTAADLAALEQGVHLCDGFPCVDAVGHFDFLHPVPLVKADALLIGAEREVDDIVFDVGLPRADRAVTRSLGQINEVARAAFHRGKRSRKDAAAALHIADIGLLLALGRVIGRTAVVANLVDAEIREAEFLAFNRL